MITRQQPKIAYSSPVAPPADRAYTLWFRRTTPAQRDRFINLYEMVATSITLDELKYNNKYDTACEILILAITKTLYHNDLSSRLSFLEDDLTDLGISKTQMITTLQKHNLLNKNSI